VQALILVGGEGTRLRPLTSTIPKPVVPLAGRPFLSYMIEWLRRHGVDDVILCLGFLADGVRAVLGDGSELGVRLRYVEEPEPLGTGGALKYAGDQLEGRFLMLNGDVLTDMDLSAQLDQHERTGAVATLALMGVDDPSAYGLVRLDASNAVTDFVEKPRPDQIDTNLVNAGAYVLEREVLDIMPPAGTNCSIERDVFPKLVGAGLYGYEAAGYWLDIGTPGRYLQATYDILERNVETELGARLASADGLALDGARNNGRLLRPALIGSGSVIGFGATVGGRVVLGRDVSVGQDAMVMDAAVLDGAVIGDRTVITGSIIGRGAVIGADCRIAGGAVLGEGVRIAARNTLAAGARIFPGVDLPEGAIAF
jgi:mannose-1-phosphate guanylyltransferase